MSPVRIPARGAALAAVAVLLLAVSPARAGIVGSPHDFSTSSSLSGYVNNPIATAGVCAFCHIPPQAPADILWPRDLSGYDNAFLMDGGTGSSSDFANYRRAVTVQCYDCHDFHAPRGGSPIVNNSPPYDNFLASHKPQNIAFGFSMEGTKDPNSTMAENVPGGTVSGYYENSPPWDNNDASTYFGADARSSPGYFRRNNLAVDNVHLNQTGGHFFKSADPNTAKGVYKGDKLPCNDCHDAHAWNSETKDWQAFFRPAKLYGYPPATGSRWVQIYGSTGKPTGSTYMANPVISGARSDPESRKMCILCHGDSVTYNSVTFAEINSDYASNINIVRPKTNVAEHAGLSGLACVSCHKHNSIGANCSQCHGFPPSEPASPTYPATAASTFLPSPDPHARDSHARHYGAESGQDRTGLYRFECKTCHWGSALGGDAGLSQHNNGYISVVIEGKWTRAPNGPGGAYDNMNYFNPAYPAGPRGELDNSTALGGWGYGTRFGGNTCRDVYCHSNGRDNSVMTSADYDNVVWNSGPRRCNGCHGRTTPDNVFRTGMPDYANGGPGLSANSHEAHVVGNAIGCGVCHADTTTDAAWATGRSITGTVHLDNTKTRNVRLTGVGGSASYAVSTDNHIGYCSNVNCHGAPVAWGDRLGCAGCHLGAGDVDDFGTGSFASMDNNGLTARVDNTEWMWSGHGATSATKPGGQYDCTLAPVAAFGGGNPCSYCHDTSVKHDNTANPFRLANNGWNDLGWNGNCYICHLVGTSGGYTPPPDNTGTYPNIIASSASRVSNNHYNQGVSGSESNARHNGTYNGGAFCWDCHDPHGDRASGGGNIVMIGSRVSMRTDNVFGIPYNGNDNSYRPAPAFVSNVTGGDYASTDNASPFNGICEVCHLRASGILHYDNAARLDSTHLTTKCTVCHTHNAGFRGIGGPDVEQYFDNAYNNASASPGQENYDDKSRHPLTNGTTSSALLFGGTENCLGCHGAKYKSSGVDHYSNECLKCHFEHVSDSNPNLDGTRHMNRVIELATITNNNLPGSQYAIGSLAAYDSWCLQCHSRTDITLGGIGPDPARKTVIDTAAFTNGRHRASTVGCIYCHQPHGRTNTRVVRENPQNRRSAGATPRMFGVYPNDNTGSYGTPQSQFLNYRSRVVPNYADAGDENAYCNVGCHWALTHNDNAFLKDKMIRRDNITGNYILAPDNRKVYLVNSVEYVGDTTALPDSHGHSNAEIIPTKDMVDYYAAAAGLTGPSRYRYPGGNARPDSFNNATSPLPLFPDYGPDGDRTFDNAYNGTGWVLTYRFTCSTCHNPHGTTLPNTSGGSGYPDLREPRNSPPTLCLRCHN